jgi:hypothetical protein
LRNFGQNWAKIFIYFTNTQVNFYDAVCALFQFMCVLEFWESLCILNDNFGQFFGFTALNLMYMRLIETQVYTELYNMFTIFFQLIELY